MLIINKHMKVAYSQKIPQKIKAFTLIEVMTSVAILTMVILGPITAAINASSYSKQVKDVMISTDLAEESLELLHYKYNTIYIQCKNTVAGVCDPSAYVTGDENDPAKIAWRLFKTFLYNNVTSGCFNADGCSFDFLDMTDTAAGKYYLSTDGECPTISLVKSDTGTDPLERKYYVCSGIDNGTRLKDTLISFTSTVYTRKVVVKSIPQPPYAVFASFEPAIATDNAANLSLYHDDLQMTATVTFSKPNGSIRTVKVIDFVHFNPAANTSSS